MSKYVYSFKGRDRIILYDILIQKTLHDIKNLAGARITESMEKMNKTGKF